MKALPEETKQRINYDMAIINLLLEKGIITAEEFDRELARTVSFSDQIEAKILDELRKKRQG